MDAEWDPPGAPSGTRNGDQNRHPNGAGWGPRSGPEMGPKPDPFSEGWEDRIIRGRGTGRERGEYYKGAGNGTGEGECPPLPLTRMAATWYGCP